MMSFNDFAHKYKLGNKATLNIEVCQVLSSLYLNDVGIYFRDGQFESDVGIVTVHPSEGTHWVVHFNENYFDSYGCAPPQTLSKFNIKRNGLCLFSEYKTQSLDSYCASYCLYKTYFTNLIGLDFKCAVLNIYYQTVS